MKTSSNIQSNNRVKTTITEAEGIHVGDTVRHNKHEEVATVTAIREAFVNRCDGYRYLYTLDFGQSVKGPFGVELNGGEFLREAFTPCTPDGRDLLPECADNEEGKQLYRDTYRDCIDEVIRDVVSLQTNINGGRKGGWIDLDSATRIIGERIFIATKSNNAEYNSETVLREYVMEELCRLQDAGRIDATTNKHGQTIIKWTPERILAYIARCKELEAEALAQMPYKVGDTVTSCYGDTGRVIEMYPEVTGDTDSPHLIYEHDGKPFVSVVILDADGKRHSANWSVFTLEPASEIKPADNEAA